MGPGEELVEDLPVELQYEQVDMNNPKMDMLEWMVRVLNEVAVHVPSVGH